MFVNQSGCEVFIRDAKHVLIKGDSSGAGPLGCNRAGDVVIDWGVIQRRNRGLLTQGQGR